MSVPIVSFHGVTKRHPGVVANEDVTFDLHPGEIVGLVGKNGAGKSTVIRILAGVEQPDSGFIRIAGNPVSITTAQQATQLGLGFVHQELQDIPMLTVAENIRLGLGYPNHLGLIRKSDLARLAQAKLALLGAPIDPMRLVSTLSIAERRMVMIARALAIDARVLVLDEPTASLTDDEIADLQRVLGKLRQEGLCIVYVSHRLQEILSLTDRVVVMRNGRVVAEHPTADLGMARLVEDITGRTQSSAAGRVSSSRSVGGDRLVLSNLRLAQHAEPFDLALQAGEILGLAGLNGAGRSEILRAAFGADRMPGLSVTVNNRRIDVRSPGRALSHGIALVPEDRRNQGAILNFSVEDNITLSSLKKYRIHNTLPFPAKGSERAAAGRYIDDLGIKTPSGETRIATLSGGNQQKTILARCLARDVKWLFLDEPTHGIDVEAKEEIFRQIQELARSGLGIIYVSSDFSEIVRVAQRVVVIRERSFAGELTGDAISEQRILQLCYGHQGAVSDTNLQAGTMIGHR